MKYKSVVVTQRGGPEVLQIRDNERWSLPRELLIRMLAAGVGRTDINYRYGHSPFSPKSLLCRVMRLWASWMRLEKNVPRFRIGDRVAALTGQGSYTEMIYQAQEHLVPVPETLAPADVVTLILNYVTAYQMFYRVAKVVVGNKLLLIGASGGVGTTLVQPGKLAGLKMYGTASVSKHAELAEWVVIPIDYHTQDFVDVVRQQEPDGLDFVFDGMGGRIQQLQPGCASFRRQAGDLCCARGLGSLLLGAIRMAWVKIRPDGKSAEFYGISVLYMRDKKPFMEDLSRLFKLLGEGSILPALLVSANHWPHLPDINHLFRLCRRYQPAKS